jgi:hypothetical protein
MQSTAAAASTAVVDYLAMDAESAASLAAVGSTSITAV